MGLLTCQKKKNLCCGVGEKYRVNLGIIWNTSISGTDSATGKCKSAKQYAFS